MYSLDRLYYCVYNALGVSVRKSRERLAEQSESLSETKENSNQSHKAGVNEQGKQWKYLVLKDQ